MTAFDRCFEILIGHEGKFGADPRDRGNWTSGQCGVGQCKGTKFGISAASYPKVDIANLTLDQAKAIYRRDYWDKIRGDELPPMLALIVFDSAVNNGVGQAVRWLQAAARVTPDGALGSVSMAAIGRGVPQELAIEFQAQRTVAMAALGTWDTYGLGWARRLCRLPYEAVSLATPTS